MHPEVREAKAWVFMHYPYFSAALSRFRYVYVKDVTAFITEGGTVGYGDWFLSLPVTQRAGILIHEAMHWLLEHARRRGDRDPSIWNVAADLEINDDFEAILPREALIPWRMNLTPHRTAEEYYEALKNRGIRILVPCGSGAGNPHPAEGGLREEKGIGEVERRLIAKSVAQEVAKAKANGRGKVPAALARWAEEVLNPKVDWKKLLLQLVRGACAHSNLAKLDYTFRKPSRRSGEFILPSLRTDVPKVSLVVDTSGSISRRDISQFKAEVLSILKLVGKIDLITCDAKAQRARVNGPWEGGGGTDLRVGIELALKSKPDVIVVLTDGLTPWPESPLPVPLIVATTQREGPPWSKTVKLGN